MRTAAPRTRIPAENADSARPADTHSPRGVHTSPSA